MIKYRKLLVDGICTINIYEKNDENLVKNQKNKINLQKKSY